jgi:hypothetical protein
MSGEQQMKTLAFALFLFTFVPSAISQCDATINPNDSIGSVKAKLACFAAENAKLKQDLANSQGVRFDSWLMTGAFSRNFAPTDFSIDKCKATATAVIVNRGGTVLQTSPGNFVEFRLGGSLVSVLCTLFSTPDRGLIVVAGPDKDAGQDLSGALRDQIFPR